MNSYSLLNASGKEIKTNLQNVLKDLVQLLLLSVWILGVVFYVGIALCPPRKVSTLMH